MYSVKTRITEKLKCVFMRNRYSIGGIKSKKNQVNLEWWSKKVNVGDELANVVYAHMLESGKCSTDYKTKKTVHLLTIGSLIGMRNFDAVVWGSGVHTFVTIKKTIINRKRTKLDVRAVRGPVTRSLLDSCGYNCKNAVLGDPAVIMPDIYKPENTEKKYKFSVIMHLKTKDAERYRQNYHCISVDTKDYKTFIDEIVQSELVISSSLHGIILAEAYGVPAIFLNEDFLMGNELMKFYDWYFSTGRENVIIARSVEDALNLTPMPVPELENMKKGLIASFPYDLWGK